MFEYYNCPKQTCQPLTRVRCNPGYYYKTADNYNRCVECSADFICPGGLSSNAVHIKCPPNYVYNGAKGCESMGPAKKK